MSALGPLTREPITRDGVWLAENPNRAKHGAARASLGATIALDADGRGRVFTLTAEQEARTREYAPLTVTTPARDSRGRRQPRMRPSSYTI